MQQLKELDTSLPKKPGIPWFKFIFALIAQGKTFIARSFIQLTTEKTDDKTDLPRKKDLETPYKDYKNVSLLMFAIMQEQPHLYPELITREIKLHHQDGRGWSAMHHAARLGDRNAIQLLIEHGADPSVLNDTNATYQDILALTDLSAARISNPNLKSQIEALSGKPKYVEEIFIDRKLLLCQWAGNKHPESREVFTGFRQAVTKFFANSTTCEHLYLQKTVVDATGKSIGMGVRTKKQIAPGEVICVYAGEYISAAQEKNRDPEYLLMPVDSKKLRGAGAMVNDGFPNAFLTGEVNCHGLPITPLVVACCDIKPGEEIFVDYGKNDCKETFHTIPNLSEFLAFFKKIKFGDYLASLPKKDSKDIKYLDAYRKLSYVANTYQAFLTLLLHKLATVSEIKALGNHNIAKNSRLSNFINSNWQSVVDFFISTHKEKALVENYLRELLPQNKCKVVTDFILNHKQLFIDLSKIKTTEEKYQWLEFANQHFTDLENQHFSQKNYRSHI